MQIIEITHTLRLRMPQKLEWDLALSWYENPKVMYFSEGVIGEVYTLFNIYNMYEFLSTRGDFYYIEVFEDGRWKPIGDVTLWDENIPIAIGDEAYWGQGIGKQVLRALIARAKQKGMKKLFVPAIFHYNIASQKLFESVGFVQVAENETEKSYELKL